MVLLDTHVWMWWVDVPALLSDAAARAIDAADSLGVSAVSCWEVGMLASKRRIELDRDPSAWIKRALSRPGIMPIPLDSPVALEAALLDPRSFPPDQADRMIYATARSRGAVLLTKDKRLREYDPRGTLW